MIRMPTTKNSTVTKKVIGPRMPDMARWALYKRIGARIRFYRNAMGQTLNQVASEVGCAGTMLHKIETGDAPPPMHIVASCAKYFGVTMNDLVPMEDK